MDLASIFSGANPKRAQKVPLHRAPDSKRSPNFHYMYEDAFKIQKMIVIKVLVQVV